MSKVISISNLSKQKNMSNNFKNIVLGLLALVVFGACSTETKEEVGRYVPIGADVLDTKTGIVYVTRFNKDTTCFFYEVDRINKKVSKISRVDNL